MPFPSTFHISGSNSAYLVFAFSYFCIGNAFIEKEGGLIAKTETLFNLEPSNLFCRR